MQALRWILPLALVLGACQAPPAAQVTAPFVSVRPPDPAPRPTASPAPTASPGSFAASPPTLPSAPATPVPDAALRFTAIGASDVFGLGADDPASQNWASVAAKRLEAGRGLPVALTKIGVLSRLAAEMRRLDVARAVAARPQVVALWTGANDIRSGVPLAEFKADLAAILTGLAAAGARVYVLNLPDLDRLPFFAEHREAYRAVVPAWQATIREVSAAHGATAIDLAGYSGELEAHPEYLWADGFHPSTAGYARLGEIVALAIGKDLPAAR